jgi:hypothetical protein
MKGKLRRVTTLSHLFRVGVRSYAARGPYRRYADFVEELFDLPAGTINGLEAQPRIRLSARDEENYPRIASQWGLHPDAFQIVCFFQSIVLAKCYGRWDEVMMLFCDFFARHFPQKRVEFIIACGPDELHPAGLKKADIAEAFSTFTGKVQNARVLVGSTPSLRDLAILVNHAALVFSNDTGPGHLAGALHIPIIVPYLPGSLYSKQVWSSTLWHRGVTLEPNPFSYQQVKEAILWDRTEIIDSIAPQRLCNEAVAIVRSVASAPSRYGNACLLLEG